MSRFAEPLGRRTYDAAGWSPPWPASSRSLAGGGGAFARTLAHNLYEHKRLAELPGHPEVIFTSTDLSKGHAFRVASAYIGSWDYGYVEPTPTSVRLSMAVAASAAFPPSLTVINLRARR
jgi:hypothetical protein